MPVSGGGSLRQVTGWTGHCSRWLEQSDTLSVRLPMNSSLCTEDWQVRKILLSTGQMQDGPMYVDVVMF